MAALDTFHRAVEGTLATKRVGTPLFVRYLLQAPVAAKAAPHFLAHVVHTVSGWLGQELQRIYALGSVKGRHVTLTLEYRGGGTAQVSWVGAAGRGPGVDLMLVGNRGAAYHDLGMANAWEALVMPGETPAPKELTAWVERALRSGQPERAS